MRRFWLKAGSVAVLLLLWEIGPRIDTINSIFFPPLSRVLDAWWNLLVSGVLLEHVRTSLGRSLSGFLFAIAYAVPLGLAVGWYKKVAELLNPLIEAFRNTASLALLPIFILILGIGEMSKIGLIIFSCTWPLLLNTIGGVRSVDPMLIKSARSLNLSPLAMFAKVVVPAAVPSIFVGIRLAGASSILALIAAEMVGARAGIGFLIIYSQNNFQIPNMYAGIITISMIGIGMNTALVKLERRFSAWKQT